MKKSNQYIKSSIKNAVESLTPDILPQLLQNIEKGEYREMTNEYSIPKTTDASVNSGSRFKIGRWAAVIAASFAILIAGYSGYTYYSPQSVIGIDINPSIELSINKSEKVLKVNALNEDAKIVIGDMSLKNVDLDVAINALIGSMVKNGYIDDMKNSILISVDSKDDDEASRLQQHLSYEIDKLLNSYAVQAAILSQTTKPDDRIKQLSRQYEISTGKVCLIEQLIEQNPDLLYEKAATLSINDLNLLMDRKQQRIRGVNASGKASDKEYIGDKKALEIALGEAGFLEKDLTKLEIELDYEDGRMIYEVEFYAGNKKFEYEIDAKTGKIIEIEMKVKQPGKSLPSGNEVSEPISNGNQDRNRERHQDGTHNKLPPKSGDNTDYIGSKNALQIALTHAKITESQVDNIEIERERENGIMIYEVEFTYNGKEYEYEIDACTGKILELEVEDKD